MSKIMPDAKITAAEIMALDEKQLDRYLKENMRIVHVRDPGNLNEAFLQRLRARSHNSKSVAVDPVKLTARLLEGPTYEERPMRYSSPATPVRHSSPAISATSTEEFDEEDEKELERKYYYDLVNSGGRPSHPLERMEDIVDNPGEYREILSYWQPSCNPSYSDVYYLQSGRWLKFRRIQRVVRAGPSQGDRHLLGSGGEGVGDDFAWDDFARRFPRYFSGTLGFPEYVQSAKERLARHGFTRPFELDRDLAKQDKLATWIEFINWEYVFYEACTFRVKKYERRRDKAWKTLIDSGILKQNEMKEELWSGNNDCWISNEFRFAGEQVNARRHDLALAENALATLREFTTPQQDLQDLQRRVAKAQATLAVAEDTYTRASLRYDGIDPYVTSVRDHQFEKKTAARHEILLRWMLQQIPLIEQEEGISLDDHDDPAAAGADTERAPPPSNARHDSSNVHERPTDKSPSSVPALSTSPRRGGKRSRDDSSSDARPSKKAKRNDETTNRAPARDGASLNGQRSTVTASRLAQISQPRAKRKGRVQRGARGKDADLSHPSPRANLRRSARIRKINSGTESKKTVPRKQRRP